jgi:hypothetical protein
VPSAASNARSACSSLQRGACSKTFSLAVMGSRFYRPIPTR